jgi:hypothetical protein
VDAPAQALEPFLPFVPDKDAHWKGILIRMADSLASRVMLPPGSDEWRDELIDRAIEWDMRIRDKRIEMFIKRHFWGRIQELTGCDYDYIFDYLEERQYKQREAKHHEIVEEGILKALEALEKGEPGEAKSLMRSTLESAENALVDRPTSPIITVGEALPALKLHLAQMQGIRFPGLRQYALEELDEATGGFSGLNLFTAASGGGKTMFVIQNLMEVMTRYSNVCCLFVSADMLADRIYMRMLTNRTRLPINVVRSGSTDTGWTAEEQALVKEGFTTLERIGSRIRVVDRFSFPNPTRTNITRAASRLMEDSGCEKCIIIIDFLELLPVPDGEKNPDAYIIEEMRTLADNDFTVLAICESGKSETNYQRGSAKNIKGDYRKVMRSDLVFTLNVCTDEELLEFYDISEQGFITARQEKDPPTGKAPELARRANRIRKGLRSKGESPMMLKLDKARDGAMCTEMYLVNHFQRNYFTPLTR